MEMLQGGQQSHVDLAHGGDVHRRGEAVVGRLAHIHVIVGMNRLLAAALSRQDFIGAPGDDLVGVHVGLRSGAGLPDHQRELFVKLARRHFARRLHDRTAQLGPQIAERHIGFRRRLFQQSEGVDENRGHAFAPNAEILFRLLG